MSGNFPDGFNQSMFDRYTEEREFYDRQEDTPKEQHSTEWLSEILKKPLVDLDGELESLAQQVGKTCEEMDRLLDLNKQLAAALRECLEDYCLSCGFGKQGCAEIHYINCRMLRLLEKAEGRRLKLNMEPEEE